MNTMTFDLVMFNTLLEVRFLIMNIAIGYHGILEYEFEQ